MFVSSFWLIHLFLLVANLSIIRLFFLLVLAYQPWIKSFLLSNQFLFVARLNVHLLLLIRSCLLPPLMFVSPFDQFLLVNPSDVCLFLLINRLLPFTNIILCGAGHILCGDLFFFINHQICWPWSFSSFPLFDQFLFLGPWWCSSPPLIFLIQCGSSPCDVHFL